MSWKRFLPPVDFRKSINGLSVLVEQELELKRTPLPAELARVEIIYDVPEAERTCERADKRVIFAA